MSDRPNQLLVIEAGRQLMHYYQGDQLISSYAISTAKNGLGERIHSECTPRGWHQIHSIIGLENKKNAVFVGREWTGEIYSQALAAQYPERDWILTRILRLEGLETGRNQGGEVDSFERYIYIHGTPDTVELGKPGSHGCIRMNNDDIIELALQLKIGAKVYIE